jgi:hypothetical protein
VFGVGVDGMVKQLWLGNSTWNWSGLGNSFANGARFAGPLSAASWDVGRLDVFGFRGGNRGGDVLQLWWGGAGWQWSNLGNGF